MARIRIRKSPISRAQREYELAWREGYAAGSHRRDVQYKQALSDYKKAMAGTAREIDNMLVHQVDLDDEISELQRQLSEAHERLFKVEQARDGWRQQCRELTFENKHERGK